MLSLNKDDKQARSVFVGNIPYDCSEDELKSIFSKVGPVISFRLVYDRETGKAKGYGFCEYADVETASSAIRNLNGSEFHNRFLRVASPACEKSKEENKVPSEEKPEQVKPVVQDSNYGTEVPVGESPDHITNIISNMPSEKLFDFLKQIKESAKNSFDETREMLIQNPQLAYALLQTLLIMGVIDSKAANNVLLDKPIEYNDRIKTYDKVAVDSVASDHFKHDKINNSKFQTNISKPNNSFQNASFVAPSFHPMNVQTVPPARNVIPLTKPPVMTGTHFPAQYQVPPMQNVMNPNTLNNGHSFAEHKHHEPILNPSHTNLVGNFQVQNNMQPLTVPPPMNNDVFKTQVNHQSAAGFSNFGCMPKSEVNMSNQINLNHQDQILQNVGIVVASNTSVPLTPSGNNAVNIPRNVNVPHYINTDSNMSMKTSLNDAQNVNLNSSSCKTENNIASVTEPNAHLANEAKLGESSIQHSKTVDKSTHHKSSLDSYNSGFTQHETLPIHDNINKKINDFPEANEPRVVENSRFQEPSYDFKDNHDNYSRDARKNSNHSRVSDYKQEIDNNFFHTNEYRNKNQPGLNYGENQHENFDNYDQYPYSHYDYSYRNTYENSYRDNMNDYTSAEFSSKDRNTRSNYYNGGQQSQPNDGYHSAYDKNYDSYLDSSSSRYRKPSRFDNHSARKRQNF